MTKFEEYTKAYWKYYISLEKQFCDTERYVEFDYVNNGNTYSTEYMKLFQAVCSEIDVVGKELAKSLDPSFVQNRSTGINEWWFHITRNIANIEESSCNLQGTNDLHPWKNYVVISNPNNKGKKYILADRKSKIPGWWNDYNSAKHDRTGANGKLKSNYHKANQRNLFNAFAALFILEKNLLLTVHERNQDVLPIEYESKLFDDDQPFYIHLVSYGE